MTPAENKQTVEPWAAGFRYWAMADGNPKSTWLITRETARAVVAQADRAAELEREVTKWRGGYAPELEELEQVRDRAAELEAALRGIKALPTPALQGGRRFFDEVQKIARAAADGAGDGGGA